DHLCQRAGGMNAGKAETLRMLGDVLAAEQVRVKAGLREGPGRVRDAQLPVEATVGKPHDPVAVRVATGRQRGPAAAAVGGRRKGIVETHPACSERSDVRA